MRAASLSLVLLGVLILVAGVAGRDSTSGRPAGVYVIPADARGWTAYAPLSDGERVFEYPSRVVVAPPGAVPANGHG